MISESWLPAKIEMIAGGASLAPRRWQFVGRHDRCLQKSIVTVDSSHDIGNKRDELKIILRGLAGCEKERACVSAETPVIVLS